jgi:PAS domain S-box-containing protein
MLSGSTALLAELLREFFGIPRAKGSNLPFRFGASSAIGWRTFFPFRSESGEVTGLIGAVMDITQLKHAQLALQQSEERFHTIFDSVNDLIFVHDFETRNFIEVNRSACEMLGFTRDELLKLNIGDISENKPPYTGRNLLSEMKAARSGMPQTFEWRGKAKDGRLLWVEISLRRAAFGGRDVLLATAREISQRKEAEVS